MCKSVLIFGLAIPFSLIGLVIGWIDKGFKFGILVALIIFGIFSLIAVIKLFFIKELSYLDVFFPIPLALLWSMVLTPFTLGEDIFSVPAVVGSAFILTLSLWKVKQSKGSIAWIIIPVLGFIYEMLPINIINPFFEYIGFA